LQIAKTASAPHGAGGPYRPPPLPDAPNYQSDAFFRPYTRFGDNFFGGDWYAGRTYEGSLWVFVADVTGHGYFAYLLATALPAVWQHCWERHPGRSPQPAELLGVMHRQLADSLPEGIFLECTLARLDPDGRATVSPAGGTRLLVRRGQRPPEVVKLRGAWLGLAAPSKEDQYELRLAAGDELILATDGAFDQLEDAGGIDSFAQTGARGSTLFDAFRERLEQSLSSSPQKDDVTLVMLRRRDAASPVVLKFPSPRADDVRV
jgi:serine phosphatase RsbU (regulator of sigma subunit)